MEICAIFFIKEGETESAINVNRNANNTL